MNSHLTYSKAKKETLLTAAYWAKVVAFVSIASIITSLLVNIIIYRNQPVLLATNLIGALIGSGLTIASVVFLYFFNKHTLSSVQDGNEIGMQRAFYNFKWYFMLNGIIILIALIVLLLSILLIGLAAGISS